MPTDPRPKFPKTPYPDPTLTAGPSDHQDHQTLICARVAPLRHLVYIVSLPACYTPNCLRSLYLSVYFMYVTVQCTQHIVYMPCMSGWRAAGNIHLTRLHGKQWTTTIREDVFQRVDVRSECALFLYDRLNWSCITARLNCSGFISQ